MAANAGEKSKVRCPRCHRTMSIPAALTRLPQPRHAAAPPPDMPPPAAPPPDMPSDSPAARPSSEAMARLMPVAVSLFLHVGVVVLLSFAFMFIPENPPVEAAQAAVVPVGDLSTPLEGFKKPPLTEKFMDDLSPSKPSPRQEDHKLVVLTPAKAPGEFAPGLEGGKTGGDVKVGIGPGGGGDGPGGGWPPIPNAAHHVVYVIDRSGSMQETLDIVREELLNNISHMLPPQDFHVIFFAAGRQRPLENRPRRLVRATEANKLEVAGFADGVIAAGSTTDPVPALRRAFAVLARADARRKGKVICLLTDGEFSDSRAVMAELEKLNRKGDVAINTILHEHHNDEAEKVLQRIAARHGGAYRFVSAFGR